MGKQAYDGPRGQTTFMFDPAEVRVIGRDTDDGPEHPLYDSRAKNPPHEATVLSLMADGQIHPIKVRKDGPRFDVVVGRGRTIAMREANRRLVEAGKEPLRIQGMVESPDDIQARSRMGAENNIRVQDTPLQRAHRAAGMRDAGMSLARIGVSLGAHVSVVSRTLKLLDCDESVQKAVDEGRVGVSAAVQLASLARADQKRVLAEVLAVRATSVDEIALAIRRSREKAGVTDGAAEIEDDDGPSELTTDEYHESIAEGGSKPREKKASEPKEIATKIPSKAVIRKVLAAVDAGTHKMHPEAVRYLRWTLGELSTKTFAGLTAVVDGE